MLTMHFCNTKLIPLVFNTFVLASLGNAHILAHGLTSFAAVYGGSCGMGAAMSAYDMRSNAAQVQAGGMAGSAGLIAYHAMRNPGWFNMRAGKAAGILFGLLSYSMVYNDKAALGGVGAGYAAFCLAL